MDSNVWLVLACVLAVAMLFTSAGLFVMAYRHNKRIARQRNQRIERINHMLDGL
jgi:cell division protein FtsX